MMRTFIVVGAVSAFLSVALGAFGAHALEARLSERLLDVYRMGNQYHMVHSLALVLAALLADRLPRAAGLIRWASWLLLGGIVLFSGSLYALALTDLGVLGAITPLGGVCFLAGWALLAMAAYRGLG